MGDAPDQAANALPVQGRLADNLVYFTRALRTAGLPVGPGAVIDALQAIEAAHIGSREDFFWTLHSIFVKKRDHSILFRQAFHLFWRRRAFLDKLIAMMSPVALAVAGVAAFPVNRWLIARGKGHAVVHKHH